MKFRRPEIPLWPQPPFLLLAGLVDSIKRNPEWKRLTQRRKDAKDRVGLRDWVEAQKHSRGEPNVPSPAIITSALSASSLRLCFFA
jgi:hypothetical protein